MKFWLGVAMGILLTVLSYWVYHTYYAEYDTVASPTAPQLLDVFRVTLEDEVAKRMSVTASGFTPALLLQTFPGLTVSDFEGAMASGGTYDVEAGSLVFVRDEGGLVPETVGGLNRAGYQTLLQNVTQRLRIDLAAGGTLTDVITALIRQEGG